MKAEAESTQRNARAKALNVDIDTNPDIVAIHKQLSNMTDLLHNNHKSKNKGGQKTNKPNGSGTQTPPNTPKKNNALVQCYRCTGWGHFARTCGSKVPVEGSVYWEQNQKQDKPAGSEKEQ